MAQQNAVTQTQEQSGSMVRSGSMPPARFIPASELFRLGPFGALSRMMAEMDRMVGMRNAAEAGGAILVPPIEISRQNGDYEVRAELPGMKPEEVKVEVTGDELVIQGERKLEREEKKDGVYRSEIQYGRFYRAVPLPEGADTEHASARFENGVLEVKVPVQETPRQHKEIPVEPSSASNPKR